MKKLISIILIFCVSNAALGDCDWSTIKQLPDGNYEYSAALNICVGQLAQDSAVKDQQISDLNKAIQLKDLALKASDDRITLWQKVSDDEQSRLAKIDQDKSKSEWLSFTLGAITVVAAGMMTARLIGR